MCGIVGYVGEKTCVPILLKGLQNLEYRGYDSAGIALIEKNCIAIKKEKGRVKNLETLLTSSKYDGTVGIAHTRWATHGKPSKENAHPHLDNRNTFAVVHNGIIENDKEIRHFLEEMDYTFYSQTDTEIIPNLIDYYYKKEEKNKENFLKAVSLTCQKLKGSYALLILCQDFPNMEIVVRKDSPLVIGKGKMEYYISSDILAVLEYTKDFYFLEDNQIAMVEKEDVQFFDYNLTSHQKQIKHIDLNYSATTKNGYEDFMLKEIFEQPTAISKTIEKTSNFSSNLNFSKEELLLFHHIYIVACGTAMHAGLVGKNVIEKLCKIPVSVEIASEFRYGNPFLNQHTLCIFISQSGETADTIAALKLAKEKGSKTLAITNVLNSSITREADYSLYTYAGPEIAVASTKAYTCQIALLYLFAIYLAEKLEKIETDVLENLKNDLLEIPSKLELILQKQQKIKEMAHQIYHEKNIFFLGRGIDYTTAMEGSLKLKEISYFPSEAYPSGELKHGPIALIENGTIVVGILTVPTLLEKSISNLQEVIARGAKTIIISSQELPKNNFDFVFTIPKTNPFLSPILSIVPLQLFAYDIAKEKGFDIDKPRNLAKSVTVE